MEKGFLIKILLSVGLVAALVFAVGQACGPVAFNKKDDGGGRDFAPKKFEKRDYGDFGNGGKKFGGSSGGAGNAGGNANYDRQFAILNEKLDKILGAMEEMANMDDGDYDDTEDQDDEMEDKE